MQLSFKHCSSKTFFRLIPILILIIDRHWQKYVPNVFKATEAVYQKATEVTSHSAEAASGIGLPVVV
jgi:hypothetical protein